MKVINKELIKRINAVLFFCQNVKNPYKLKIFKLLFFLDFIHFKKVGRPVTDLEYYAYKWGPVPIKFLDEIKREALPPGLEECIEIFSEKDEYTGDDKFTRFVSRKKPDLKVFTKREQKILQDLAFIFKEAKADEMSEISHLKNAPWDKTIREKGQYQKIDFLLAIDKEADIDIETAKERYESSKEMREFFM